MGRRDMMMNWSQENCLIDNHRKKLLAVSYTRERWGWGFY